MTEETSDQDDDDAQMRWEQGIEKLIRLIGRKTGVEADGEHGIFIDGGEVTVTLVHGHAYSLSQLLDYANQIASNEVGTNLKITADSDQRVVLTFDLVRRV